MSTLVSDQTRRLRANMPYRQLSRALRRVGLINPAEERTIDDMADRKYGPPMSLMEMDECEEYVDE